MSSFIGKWTLASGPRCTERVGEHDACSTYRHHKPVGGAYGHIGGAEPCMQANGLDYAFVACRLQNANTEPGISAVRTCMLSVLRRYR